MSGYLYEIYHGERPSFLDPYLETTPLKRLEYVGMNCGCEYTSFPRFRSLPRYSRFRHSLGAALIVWHFTRDETQALAALFHDIATPVFAHTVDFLRGDHLRQESTEEGTGAILRTSKELLALLEKRGIGVEAVEDYHRYPVADNDTPRLSADRLEYTMGNALGFGFADREELAGLYGALTVITAPDGQPELAFRSEDAAGRFGRLALCCSRIYVSPEDRYSMQALAELLREALDTGVLEDEDLMSTEPEVIAALQRNKRTRRGWERFRALREMVTDGSGLPESGKVIPAKKRCIDPLIAGGGRLSELDAAFRSELDAFLCAAQDERLFAR